MGWKLIQMSNKVATGSPANKAVLNQLAFAARDDSPVTWIGNGFMAQQSEYSTKTVERALPCLVEAGHVSILRIQGVINIHAVHPDGEWCVKPERAALEAHLRGWSKGRPPLIEIVIGWLLQLNPMLGGQAREFRPTPDKLAGVGKSNPRHRGKGPPAQCLKTPGAMSHEHKGSIKRKGSNARPIGDVLSDMPLPSGMTNAIGGGDHIADVCNEPDR